MVAKKGWEHFSHKSDIGVRGFGPTLAEAFAIGALALTNFVTDSKSIKADQMICTLVCVKG